MGSRVKHVRLTATPDPAVVPPLFTAIADAPHVTEARLHDWTHDADSVTLLLAVDGDADRLGAALADAAETEAVDVTPVDDGHAHVLVTVRPDATPMVAAVFDTVTRRGVVVVKPVVYRDGSVTADFVGDAAVLQSVVEGFPAPVSVAVEEVGTHHGWPESAASVLSDRQREAVTTALALGYYDDPRGATHRDVAAALGCAPSTASEHLKKAEAKLVRAGLGDRR